MAIPAVTTAALLSAPLVVLLFVFGTMVTSAPTELCLDGCICYNDIQNQKLKSQKTVNCTSFRPILTAASSLLSDFSHVEVLNVQNVMDGSSEFIFEGLFKVFPNVKYMNLINASISKIIDENAFKGLKQLEVLDLSRNYIYKFRPDTFIETPKLRVLDLSYNPLRLAPTTFLVSKSLEDLILSSCNLTIVPAGSFKGIPNLKVLDLYDNQIQSFTIRSFPRSLKHLWLTKNNVTNVPTKALSSLNKLTSLDLSENPINCTCSLIGLQDWFSSKGVIFENDVICSYPSEYKGENWRHVFENDVCVESVEIETTSISKQEDTSELSSCANEICDESMSDDRYIYNNAIQADQPNTEIVTEHNPVTELEKNVEDFPITPSSTVTQTKGTANDVSAVNIIEPITENVLDASDDSKINESKNLVEDITNNNDTQDIASNLDNLDSKLSESTTESQSGGGQSFPETSQSSEILKDDPVTTEGSVDILADTKTLSTGENQLDYIQTPMVLSDSTSSPETQPPVVPPSIETTTLKSDPEFSQGKGIANDNQPVLTTTEEIISETSSETPTTVGNVERDTDTTTVDPSSLIETTSPVQSTETNDSPTSTTQSELLLSVGEISENTTTTSSITTIIPSTSTSEASTTTYAPTTAEPSTTTTEVVLPVDEIGKSDNEVTTTTTSTPITESTESNTPSDALIENKGFNIETTSTSSTETTTPIPPPLLSSEKTNDVPNSKEETTVEISTTEKQVIVGQEILVEPTNKTEGIIVLPSTDNRKGKMLSSTENDDQKPPESMGSYIVLAGIIIVLLLLILYATTKNSKKSSNNKIPLQDAEHNMTELQDMATLLPSSPPVNGNKNYKYPDEEPSVTAKLLEPVDDQPESNGNGFVYPQDNELNRPEVQEKPQESNGKSTLPRTNGSSPNVAPPLELTTAKVLVMPDSLPRKPIYVQKNVNS